MKNTVMESLVKAAILQKDFMPVQNEAGNLALSPLANLLVKSASDNFILLELLDGDAMTPEEIRARLEQNGAKLEDFKFAPAHMVYEVFVFDQEPAPEKTDSIISGQVHNSLGRKFLKCFSVSLHPLQVTRHFNVPVSDHGMKKMIETLLRSGPLTGATHEEIRALTAQKSKDLEVSLRADKPVFTYGLIAVNIAVWAFISLLALRTQTDYGDWLTVFGAKDNARILSGEYWRLLTPVFLHANEIHLLINCYSLYVLGIHVERLFGHFRFITVYLIAGVIGNLASFIFSANPAVGASGAIFGLMGALLYFGLDRTSVFKRVFGYGIVTTIFINLVYGFSNSGIDNFAHLGGLVGGFLASGTVYPAEKRRWYTNPALYLVLTVVLAAGGMIYGLNQ